MKWSPLFTIDNFRDLHPPPPLPPLKIKFHLKIWALTQMCSQINLMLRNIIIANKMLTLLIMVYMIKTRSKIKIFIQ